MRRGSVGIAGGGGRRQRVPPRRGRLDQARLKAPAVRHATLCGVAAWAWHVVRFEEALHTHMRGGMASTLTKAIVVAEHGGQTLRGAIAVFPPPYCAKCATVVAMVSYYGVPHDTEAIVLLPTNSPRTQVDW